MLKTCKQCGEDFELRPDHKGLATVCPSCTGYPEQTAREAVQAESRRKAMTKAERVNAQSREKDRQEGIQVERLGFERVPGKTIKVDVPTGRK